MKAPDDQIAALKAEWHQLAHAMQTGVGFDQSTGSDDGSPKHLRVGVNVALSDHGALVKLLIDKGLITEVEYMQAIVEGMRLEVQRYEKRMSEKNGGAKITLR